MKKKIARIAWKSPEHETHKKGMSWYITISVLVAAVIVYGIYDRAWTFIAAFAVAAAAYYYFIFRETPRMLDVAVSKTGIKIGKHEYPNSEIRYFWIINKSSVKVLNIRLKKRFLPDIAIFLDGQDPEELRHFLKEKITEIDKGESMTEAFARLLKI
ncbi:hypothetical protein HZA39_04545 [Candidatus Peregrinibacteria bacterium]|nr:hypothetical protein [Candidatus Peregrinibacteria bacterium]